MENMEARQRFPRLLQLVEIYPDTMATFVAKVGYLHVLLHEDKEERMASKQSYVKSTKKVSSRW